MTVKQVGTNVKYEVDGKNVLTITIDLNKTHGKSKSGKTMTIATSNGNTKIQNKDEEEVIFGINVYRYPTDEEDAKPNKKSKRKSTPEEDDEDE